MTTTWTMNYPTRMPVGHSLPYGLRQERSFRKGLRGSSLSVRYSPELDRIHKLDCVVIHRRLPSLPAVGIQFTTKHDPEKKARTIAEYRRHRAVPRLLYLEAECPLSAGAFGIIRKLVYQTARVPRKNKVVSAVLAFDGGYFFRQVCGLTEENKGTLPQKEM